VEPSFRRAEGFAEHHVTVTAGGACLERLTSQLLIAVAIVPAFAGRRLRLGHCKELAAAIELLLSRAIGKKTVVADALKSVGQDMEEEAADELVGRERHSNGSNQRPKLFGVTDFTIRKQLAVKRL